MDAHSYANGRSAQRNGAPPRRTIGLWTATALVVGNMIGSGVFLLPSSLAAAAGPVSLVGWVFTGAGAVLLALAFANLGRAFPAAGGPYATRTRRSAASSASRPPGVTGSRSGRATPRSPWPSSATSGPLAAGLRESAAGGADRRRARVAVDGHE